MPPMLDNLCIFAHYDPDDIVDDYVLRYIRCIGECGFSVVVVSTAKLSQKWIDLLRLYCVEVIVRDNIGYDFGSWSTGLARYDNHFCGNLLLANDSVYGPIGSLNTTLATLTSRTADFYGMVESREHLSHLQSWFLLFRPHVWKHEAFKSLFVQPPNLLSKQEVILEYELAATQRLRQAGFRAGSLYSSEFRKIVANPTHFIWRQLIEKHGIPFIKVELLALNPMRISNVHEWRMVVAKRSPELIPIIDNHLARIGRLTRRSVNVGTATLTLVDKVNTRFVHNDEFLGSCGLPMIAKANLQLFKLVRHAFAMQSSVKRALARGKKHGG
jgi:lipopolysaccharide biosynthesis protein